MEDGQKVGEDLKLFSKIKQDKSNSLLHSIADGIIKRGRPSYQDHSQSLTLQEWWALTDSCESLMKKAVSDSWTKDEIQSQLQALPEAYSSSFCDVINTRREEIRQQLAANTNAISQAVLQDFDWEVKLVMSSDRLAAVQEPLLTLDLDVRSQTDIKSHSLELNRNDLKGLINSLEGANKVIQQWKT